MQKHLVVLTTIILLIAAGCAAPRQQSGPPIAEIAGMDIYTNPHGDIFIESGDYLHGYGFTSFGRMVIDASDRGKIASKLGLFVYRDWSCAEIWTGPSKRLARHSNVTIRIWCSEGEEQLVFDFGRGRNVDSEIVPLNRHQALKLIRLLRGEG